MKLPDFEIKIGDMEYENSFPDDVVIDRTNLDHEFATQAEKYAYYSFLAEKAKAKLQRAKFDLEVLYAQLDAKKRGAAAALRDQNKNFKYTEKMCENEVIGDNRYKAKKLAVIDAQELAGMLSKAADAIGQRRDMLIQMGAHDRIGNAPVRVLNQQHSHAKEVISAGTITGRTLTKQLNVAKKLRSRRTPKNE